MSFFKMQVPVRLPVYSQTKLFDGLLKLRLRGLNFFVVAELPLPRQSPVAYRDVSFFLDRSTKTEGLLRSSVECGCRRVLTAELRVLLLGFQQHLVLQRLLVLRRPLVLLRPLVPRLKRKGFRMYLFAPPEMLFHQFAVMTGSAFLRNRL